MRFKCKVKNEPTSHFQIENDRTQMGKKPYAASSLAKELRGAAGSFNLCMFKITKAKSKSSARLQYLGWEKEGGLPCDSVVREREKGRG